MYKQLQQRDMAGGSGQRFVVAGDERAGEPIACLTAYDASFALSG